MSIINFSKDKCRNCYKCIRNCPVKAIKLKDKHAQIIQSMCIGCGICITTCPHDAKEIHSDLKIIKEWLEKEEVVLSLSSLFPTVYYLDNPHQYLGMLRELGFGIIEETAIGAEAVLNSFSEEYYSKKKFVISSSCASVKNLIEMYYPQYLYALNNRVSPMIAHGRMLRQKYPNAKIVFAGPCLSKKMEVYDKDVRGIIDAVLTFDEIDNWVKEEKISPNKMPVSAFNTTGTNKGRFFPQIGGLGRCGVENFKGERRMLRIDGVQNCIQFLDEIHQLDNKYWIEMNACEEGCVNGPGNNHSILSKYEKVELLQTYIEKQGQTNDLQLELLVDTKRSFRKRPVHHLGEVPEEEIKRILGEMSKFNVQDELNCGTCGYETCRDKARAVYWNMADKGMCLPLISSQNEAISNSIITSTPNAIVVLDKKHRIIEYNKAAEHLFNVGRKDVFNYKFEDALDYDPFKKLNIELKHLYTGKGHYDRENRVFMEILTYIPEQELYMGLFIDITKQEQQEQAIQKMQKETFKMVQRVIDKQMRVAHEIAGLLGETTAETKVTLTKLQRAVANGRDEL